MNVFVARVSRESQPRGISAANAAPRCGKLKGESSLRLNSVIGSGREGDERERKGQSFLGNT